MAEQVAMVLAVFALLLGVLWMLKKRGLASLASPLRRGSGARRRLEVLERVPLTPQHAVHLVRVAGKDRSHRNRAFGLHAAGRPIPEHTSARQNGAEQPLIRCVSISILLLAVRRTCRISSQSDPVVPVFGGANAKGLTLSTPMQIVILLTLLTLLPAAVMCVSPFLRIAMVLHFLRQASGHAIGAVQSGTGRTVAVSHLVMQPVVTDIYHRGWEPVERAR